MSHEIFSQKPLVVGCTYVGVHSANAGGTFHLFYWRGRNVYRGETRCCNGVHRSFFWRHHLGVLFRLICVLGDHEIGKRCLEEILPTTFRGPFEKSGLWIQHQQVAYQHLGV